MQQCHINYGASPGDEYVAQPYLYVGPPAPPPPTEDGFWNAPFGAFLTWDKSHSVADAVDFFRRGRRLAGRGRRDWGPVSRSALSHFRW
ncbi:MULTISPECIES: hypothetical protein [Pseudofrankia]|uniref:hypothetical protein n=1 Tax=Pseudofrankia TaxID=2994363 RepID=UPI000234CA30|nr:MULTISPECIES: hypothetical protein [Pseudofrankia]OHV33394.1 hypothetical protein BCD49_27430 [Pseudofrankia sp. EUN1h]